MGIAWAGPALQMPPIEDTLEDPRLVSQMSAGRPQVRRRFTDAVRVVSFKVIATGAERISFETWFANTVRYTLPVNIEDPLDDQVKEFVFKSMPTWRLVRTDTVNDRLWESVFEFWRLP